MSGPESTIMPDSPEPVVVTQAGGSHASGPAALSAARLVYWSVLRELWEHRWLYIAPLVVAAVFLVGFVIAAARIPFPLPLAAQLTTPSAAHRLEQLFDFASGALMLTYVVVAVIYCLAALHTERSDRSILFWKSLPVSNVTTVIAKACIPIVLLPLITFVIIVATQIIMLLAGSAVLLGRGIGVEALWAHTPVLPMWAAALYHLVTMHALYWAPFYGWLLLASAWARRAAFLWAGVPVAAVLIIEKLVFNTSTFGHMLLSQLGAARQPFLTPTGKHAHAGADAGQPGGVPREPGIVGGPCGVRDFPGCGGEPAQISGTDLMQSHTSDMVR